MDDLHAMLKLEPANPAALQLLDRLQAKPMSSIKQAASAKDESALASESRSCSLTNETTIRSRLELAEAAELAWKVLQEEESQMRQAVQAKKPSMVSKKKKKKPQQTAVVTPARKQISQHHHQQQQRPSNSKINDLWESLAQEEQSTVAKVYQKRRTNTKSR